MIAHLAELHQAVDDAHVVAAGKAFTGLGTRHKVIIQEALSLRQATRHHMLILLRHLLLYIRLETAKDKWPKYSVQLCDSSAGLIVHGVGIFGCLAEWIREPVLKIFHVRKCSTRCGHFRDALRHKEVHETPEIHEIILQGSTCEQEAALRVEAEEGLPPLGAKVFDMMSFVQHEIRPWLPTKDVLIS